MRHDISDKPSDGGDGIAERSHGSERSDVNAKQSVSADRCDGIAERSDVNVDKQSDGGDGIAERGDGSAERTTSAPRKTWWRTRELTAISILGVIIYPCSIGESALCRAQFASSSAMEVE